MTALRTQSHRRRREEGDVHVGSMGGDVAPAPGSTTQAGSKAVDELMAELLDEVRRHIRSRVKTVHETRR